VEDLLGRITTNERVLCGKPTIRGMRISVEQLIKALDAGVPEEDLLNDYPVLESADLLAVRAFQQREKHS
jgi:uncharacterized protein (DUF433 family)